MFYIVHTAYINGYNYFTYTFQPSISVGNVGQLAVDLMINTLKLPRVGYLSDPAVLPLIGNDAFDHTQPAGHLHTSAEGTLCDYFMSSSLLTHSVVYASKELQLAIVQFRAPIAKV